MTFQPNQTVYAQTIVNVRRSPGYVGKPADDVLGMIAYATPITVTGPATLADNLAWWPVRATSMDGSVAEGWAAETMGTDVLLAAEPPAVAPTLPPPITTYTPGEPVIVVSPEPVNIRASVGYLDKPPEDVLAAVASSANLTVAGGPQLADGLSWWQVSDVPVGGQLLAGWIADAGPNGVRFITLARLRSLIAVRRPFAGFAAVSRWWGVEPAFYSQFTYDFVPLKGHNGIDFAMDPQTPLLATDAGSIIKVDFEEKGFGHHLVIQHAWGESLYAHLERVDVNKHQIVEAGAPLGLSGNSGASTGPHLHFGIRLFPYRRADGWGGFCDPRPFMDPADLVQSRAPQTPPTPMGPELPGRPRP